MSSATLQNDPSVETFFNVAETETLALFEHLSFEFLTEVDVFAPPKTGRTREHEPPELMRASSIATTTTSTASVPLNENFATWLSG